MSAAGTAAVSPAAVDVTAGCLPDGTVYLMLPGGEQVEVATPYALALGLKHAIALRTGIRAPYARHLGPVAGDD